MFTNFIYFLVALILYTTCHHPGGGGMPDYALVFALVLAVIFALVCHISFKRLAARSSLEAGVQIDILLDQLLLRLSILALFVFAADLYILKLKLALAEFPPFQIFPTLEALVFLFIFLGYLVIVWTSAWRVQRQFFPGTVSKKSFVISNISFSLPALLPWFILSFVADSIQILPFEGLKRALATPAGEILYMVFFLFAVATFGPYLIQKLWGCSSLEPGPTRDRIEALCTHGGIGYADILKWELFGGSMITAGVMGLVARFRYILVTPALINFMTPREIDAVIAHEIGHVKKHHILFYLLFFAGYIALVYALFDPLLILIYGLNPLSWLVTFAGMEQETVSTLVFSLILILFFLVYFRFGFGFFMRNFERQADTYVFSLLGSGQSLIDAFYKIARFSRTASDRPNWHHFNISQRIDFMERCELNPGLVKRHDRKIRQMVAGYAVFMVMVVFAGYLINFGPGKEVMNNYLAERLLIQALEVDPQNVDAHTLMGDYYYGRKMFERAVHAYENVLKIAPLNLQALNNLAWLLLTCEDTSFLDPERALVLARRAIAVDTPSHVLDTYAEACWQNDLAREALEAATKALEQAEDRLDYYRSQVQRFVQPHNERG
ncbi:MAG: M48 family metalloprotease [Desulfobacterium sp.]|jgi:Zn-dependent protease with chaperone function|nr:M48 family metalloprotease [Desulfobacterium sp.]